MSDAAAGDLYRSPLSSGGMADDSDLVESRIDSETVFDGRLLRVQRDRVRLPDGREATREYARHPGAAVVVPLFDDGRVLIVRQFRYPCGRVFIEFPAGKIDHGEPPLTTAVRELREETGYVAHSFHRIATLHPTIGYADEIMTMFVARGLTQKTQQLDEGEFLKLDVVTVPWLIEQMRNGHITDTKTLSCLFWLRLLQSGEVPWPPAAPSVPAEAG